MKLLSASQDMLLLNRAVTLPVRASASKSEGNTNVIFSIKMQEPHSVDRIYNSLLPNVE